MRFLIAAILVLLMSSLANSEIQTGPYTISFDINANLNYEVLHDRRPMQTESATTYRLLIKTNDSAAASISVTKYNEITDATTAVYKSIVPMYLMFRGINVTSIDDMTIDNQPGFLVSGVKYVKGNEVNFYNAIYWLKNLDCDCGPVEFGKIRVDVSSTYSKDITIGILNSLRVVKSNAYV